MKLLRIFSLAAALLGGFFVPAQAQTYTPPLGCLQFESFGALGNNSTLNDAAWTAAMTAGGGCIQVGPGTFRFSSAISRTIAIGGQFSLIGSGSGITSFRFSGTNGLSLVYADRTASSHISGISFLTASNGTYNGISYSVTSPAAAPSGAPNTINDVSLHGADGFNLANFWQNGILIGGGASAFNINGITIAGNAGFGGTGLYLAGVAGTTCSGGPCYGVVFNITNSIFNSLGTGIGYSDYIQGVSITDCNFTAGNIAIAVNSIGNEQLLISGSQFDYAGTAIIAQSIASQVSIIGNLFLSPGNEWVIQGHLNQYSIIGNSFNASSPTNGMAINVTAGGFGVISGNSFFNFATCVNLAAGTAVNNVQGNVYSTCSTTVNNAAGGANTVGVATQ